MDFSVALPASSGGGAVTENAAASINFEEASGTGNAASGDVPMDGGEVVTRGGNDDGMEGIDTGAVQENTESLAVRPAFVDHLKSPIITLIVGPPDRETSLTVHQLFLSRSPYFQNIFTGSPTRTIALPDEDLDAVGCLLQFLYTGEYFPRIIKGPTGEEYLETGEGAGTDIDEDGGHLLKHAKVYTLAEKLGIAELKHLAHAKIHRINSTAKGELVYARYVYANTAREDTTIRGPIASFWAHRSHILRHEAEDEFRRMVLEFPQFAYDILSMVLDQKEKGSRDRDKDDGGPSGSLERSKSGRKRPRLSTLA